MKNVIFIRSVVLIQNILDGKLEIQDEVKSVLKMLEAQQKARGCRLRSSFREQK